LNFPDDIEYIKYQNLSINNIGGYMRYLILVDDREQWPMEMAGAIIDGILAWGDAWVKAGKFEKIWVNAGGKGGGAIANVSSHLELHEIMSGYPAFGTDAIKVTPIEDFFKGIEINKKAFEEAMKKMQG
jgi:muconolactone delta-isomerase